MVEKLIVIQSQICNRMVNKVTAKNYADFLTNY